MDTTVTMSTEDSVSSYPTNSTVNGSYVVTSGDNNAGGEMFTVIQVDFWLALVTIPTLCCLGIVGNVLTIVVWQRAKGFSATLFLFKYLAGWDTAYLALTVLHNYNLRDRRLAFNQALVHSVYHVSSFVQMVSVHVTLLIAVTRWVLVKFPWQSMDLLASRRVYWHCGLIALYCASLQTAQVVFSIFHPSDTVVFIIRRILGLALPFLLLFVFNLALLRIVTRHIRRLREMKMQTLSKSQSDTPANSSSQSNDASSASSEKEVREAAAQIRERHRQDSDNEWSRKQRMVKAVLLVSLCSFIAYPIGVSVQIFAVERAEPSLLSRYVILHVAHLCQVINSGINILIYWGLIPRFRSLAKKLRRYLAARLCCTSAFDFPRR